MNLTGYITPTPKRRHNGVSLVKRFARMIRDTARFERFQAKPFLLRKKFDAPWLRRLAREHDARIRVYTTSRFYENPANADLDPRFHGPADRELSPFAKSLFRRTRGPAL
jgi:hypothetical protein